MKRLLFEIGLNDKFSRNMKKIAGGSKSSIDKINKSLTKTKPLSRNIDQLEAKLRKLEKKRKLSFDTKEIKSASKQIKSVERELARIEKKGKIKKKGASGGVGSFNKAGLVGMGLGALYGGVKLGTEIVQTTAKYERFEAVLKNTYGSGMKAKQVMNNLSNFASKTPFQIDELTSSFIKLKNAGLEPSMAEMTNLGDLASSQGKSFGQLSEALLDAQMGEFERLKEFGIKGATGKNSYKFTFKGETKEIAKSSKAVKEYILSLGKLKGVQGGMNAISKTTGGQLSNMADNWDQLKATMGDANSGVIKASIGGFSALVGKANDYMKVPLSMKMKEERAGTNALISVITDHNTTSEDRLRLLTQLKEEYPDFLGNLDTETASNEDLLKRLDAVNASYEKRISLQSALEVQDWNKKKLKNAEDDKDRAVNQLQLLKDARNGDKGAEELLLNNQTSSDLLKRFLTPENYLKVISGNFFSIKGRDKEAFYKKMEEEQKGIIKEAKERLKKNNVDVTAKELTAYLDNKNPNLDKLSGDKKNRYNDLMSQLKSDKKVLDSLMQNKNFNSDNINYKEKVKHITELKSLIGELFKEEDDATKTKVLGHRDFGSKTRLLKNDEIANISGDNRVAKNLTININELMSGDINIVTNALKEGSAEAKQVLLEALLSVLNDVNGA